MKRKLRALKQKRAMIETALQYLEEQLRGKPRAIRRLNVVKAIIGEERMTTERLHHVISELRSDLGRLELAITALEVYASGQKRGPGRPPKRLQELLGRSRKKSSKRKGGEAKKAE